MIDFEARRARRIDRQRARSVKLAAHAERLAARRDQIVNLIPTGQPILVGHHSERGHRKLIQELDQSFGREVEARREADTLARRADNAETSHAVSGDDPAALEKLREKLSLAQRAHAALKAGGNGGWRLSNLRAEIRRLEGRIVVIERERERAENPPPAIGVGEVSIIEAENRVRIVFPAKPNDATRALLKSHGFRWAPSVGAWQRQVSDDARYWARKIVGA